MIKKLTYRFLMLLIGLVGLNFIYTYFFFESDLQEHSPIINQIRALPKNTEVIYIGESSNLTYAESDSDKRMISEFLNEYLDGPQVGHITKPASHAGIYKTLLHNVNEELPIKTAVITLNLRSFNAGWKYSELETSLQKSMVLLRNYPPFVNRMMLSFKDYEIKTKEQRQDQMFADWENKKLKFDSERPFTNTREWDTYMAHKGVLDSLGNFDQSQTELACHYIKGYSFHIDTTSDVRIKDFEEIIALCKSRGWNIVFNLLAENMEKADQLVGDDLVHMIEENEKILIEFFERRAVTVVNNLKSVSNKHFIDQNWTTEHYDESGRKVIAKNLADKIKSLN